MHQIREETFLSDEDSNLLINLGTKVDSKDGVVSEKIVRLYVRSTAPRMRDKGPLCCL